MKMRLIITIITLLIVQMGFSQGELETKKTMVPALLVIDVQKKFMPMMSKEDQESAVEMMNWTIWVFRQHKLPVIRIYHTSEEWGPAPGTDEFEFDDRIKVEENDPKVINTYGSGFNKTELNDLLMEQGINTLFLCGLSSVGCVLATYFDAGNFDYTSFMIKDAMLSQDADYTNQIEEIFGAIDLNTVNYMLQIRR